MRGLEGLTRGGSKKEMVEHDRRLQHCLSDPDCPLAKKDADPGEGPNGGTGDQHQCVRTEEVLCSQLGDAATSVLREQERSGQNQTKDQSTDEQLRVHRVPFKKFEGNS